MWALMAIAACARPEPATLHPDAGAEVLDVWMQAEVDGWGLLCGVLASSGYAQGWWSAGETSVVEWEPCGDWCFRVAPGPWSQDVYVLPEGDGWRVEALGQRVHAVSGCGWW